MWLHFALGFLFVLQTCSCKSDDTGHDICRQLINQETLIRMTLDKRVHDLLKDVAEIKLDMMSNKKQLQDDINAIKKENLALKANLKGHHSSKLSVKEERIGFTVGMKQFGKKFRGNIMVFPYVITNTGNGYSTRTGKFTAPRDGTYVFFTTTVSHERNSVILDIVHNSISKVRTYSTGGRYETGTNLVVLDLNKGDAVWVRIDVGDKYYTYSVPLTTFSGFLL